MLTVPGRSLNFFIVSTFDFYLSKERWDEAIEIYEELETIGGFEGESAEYYQKFGYALQKRKKYAEAIQAYLKADTLKPDNIWNNRHLAICYRLNRNYQVAITYYKKVEEAAPEDTNVTFHIGSCLAELGQYEEALNYFFKLDFIACSCFWLINEHHPIPRHALIQLFSMKSSLKK